MRHENRIKELEEKRREIVSFTNELEEQLRKRKISKRKYNTQLRKQYGKKTKEDLINEIHDENKTLEQKIKHHKKIKTHLGIAGVILIMLAVISLFSQYGADTPTGFIVGAREVSHTVDYNRVFEHYTETPLDFSNLTSLMISGELQGAGATVKLRIDGNEYVVADLTNEQTGNLITGMAIAEQGEIYTLSTDKTEYAIGETAYIILEPSPENKSLYISHGDERHQLGDYTYVTETSGEHQAIALIVLPDDILRLETNFTVLDESITQTINETTNITTNETINQTTNETLNITANETINETKETTGYLFESICLETCSLEATSNPVLIVDLEENSTLTITILTITRLTENQAPEHTRTIPDITITTTQAATLDLDEYFFDPDGDTIHYDINEISEINSVVNQEIISINSIQEGIYIAYIYATDGDKLTTSNTFEIRVVKELTNITINDTINIINITNATLNVTPPANITRNQTGIAETLDPCSNPDINQRPSHCFIGIEDKVFQDLSAPVENNIGAVVGRFTRFGNFVIRGLLMQNATGNPGSEDFKIGFSQRSGFDVVQAHTAWVDSGTGNLYLRGQLYDEQDVLEPPQFNTYIIQNRFGIILGYFDELRGDLYLKGNLVQLGKI